MESLTSYLTVAALLLCMGIYGMITHRSLVGMLISVELILNAAGINFMAFNMFLTPEPAVGQIFTLFIMGIAAAETAIALSIIVSVYRQYRTIEAEEITDLKG
jgi:NADH:ubiquinone oxidoreductase subunit K